MLILKELYAFPYSYCLTLMHNPVILLSYTVHSMLWPKKRIYNTHTHKIHRSTKIKWLNNYCGHCHLPFSYFDGLYTHIHIRAGLSVKTLFWKLSIIYLVHKQNDIQFQWVSRIRYTHTHIYTISYGYLQGRNRISFYIWQEYYCVCYMMGPTK